MRKSFSSSGFSKSKTKMGFGNILKWFRGDQSETSTSRIIEEAENAESIRISPHPLHCPICFCIFGAAPVILPCGHSFCLNCIQTLIQRAIYEQAPMRPPEFECSMCRSKVSAQNKLCRNYLIEDILNSIKVPTSESVFDDNEAINSLKIQLERARQKLRDTEEKTSQLSSKLADSKKRLRWAIVTTLSLLVVLIGQWIIS